MYLRFAMPMPSLADNAERAGANISHRFVGLDGGTEGEIVVQLATRQVVENPREAARSAAARRTHRDTGKSTYIYTDKEACYKHSKSTM